MAGGERSTSFYVSFCDLIFATLIIFLIIVLSLMLKLTEQKRNFSKSISAEVELNQYSGGASDTTWGFVFVIRRGTPQVAFVPRDVWQQWVAVRSEGDSNVVYQLCSTIAADDPGLAVLPIDRFEKLGGGMSLEFMRGGLVQQEVGDVISRILAEFDGGTKSARDLYAACGGIHAGTYTPQDAPAAAARVASKAYFAFIAGPGKPLNDGDPLQFFRHYERLRTTMAAAAEATKDRPACLLFDVVESRRALVGGTELTPKELQAILGAISPGRGFYVEFIGKNEPPPAWVISDLLGPAGFDRRVLSEEASAALKTHQ